MTSAARPPPLAEETFKTARHELHAHEHAVCAYVDEADFLKAVDTFLEGSLAHDDLCVFVHSFSSDAEAWNVLERARADVPRLRATQLVVVNLYREAFEGEKPRIDHGHVQRVVAGLVDAASARGLNGVRLFVDASRRYIEDARTDEWFAFESWLGRHLQAAVGLVCAYRREDVMRPEVFPNVLRTHAYRFEGHREA